MCCLTTPCYLAVACYFTVTYMCYLMLPLCYIIIRPSLVLIPIHHASICYLSLLVTFPNMLPFPTCYPASMLPFPPYVTFLYMFLSPYMLPILKCPLCNLFQNVALPCVSPSIECCLSQHVTFPYVPIHPIYVTSPFTCCLFHV